MAHAASTAMGTEAEVVNPTLSARYVDAVPNTTPRIAPSASARNVSSGGVSSGETYGRNAASLIARSHLRAGRSVGLLDRDLDQHEAQGGVEDQPEDVRRDGVREARLHVVTDALAHRQHVR